MFTAQDTIKGIPQKPEATECLKSSNLTAQNRGLRTSDPSSSLDRPVGCLKHTLGGIDLAKEELAKQNKQGGERFLMADPSFLRI